MRQTQKVKNLCETALFIAIVFLGVFIIKFPGPFGYAHIGDSMIFLSVLMLGGKRGAAAGGTGGGCRGYCQRLYDLGAAYLYLQSNYGSTHGLHDQTPRIWTERTPPRDRSCRCQRNRSGHLLRIILASAVRTGGCHCRGSRPALPDCIRNHHRSCDFRSPAEDKLKKTLHLHN